jgi:hypothetical protein
MTTGLEPDFRQTAALPSPPSWASELNPLRKPSYEPRVYGLTLVRVYAQGAIHYFGS